MRKTLGDDIYFEMKRTAAEKMRAKKGDNFKHSEKTKELMRGPRPNTLGIPKSEEHKQKLRDAAKNRMRNPHTEETIEKMKLAWVKRKENTYTYDLYIESLKERTSTPEAIAKMRNITSNRLSNPFYKQKLYDTKPELKFQSFLEFNEIEFSKQFVISTDIGKFTYDFYIPLFNMIVEIDGEYWHSKSIEQINRDLFKMKIANKRDFVILRLSDKDYRPELIFESLDNIENHNIQLIESRLLKRI